MLRLSVNKSVRRIAAVIATFGLVFSAVFVMPTAAQAAPGDQNSAVVVSDVVLADTDGNPLTGQLTVGDQFVIQGTWDAAAADPQPDETFVIGLPSEFEFVLGGPPIHLDGLDPVSGETVTWAICEPDNTTGDLTCTFTDAVIDRDEIRGTFEFDVNAALETTETTVEFDLNGISGIVELPGGGGIDDGIDLPDEVSKSGVMNANNWSMTWTVDIPGASLVAAGGDVAHITDTLGAGHVLCGPIGLTVHTVRGETTVDVSSLASIISGAPGHGSFAFDLNAPEAGFDAGVTYRVRYQTCTPGGEIPGEPTEFSNEAQIEGWGEAGIGIGTATSKPWHQNITKSGSVLGGTDRNGKIRWTVTIPGNVIAGQDKDSFTIAETLGAGHEVTADTISGIQVVEQYGPNPGSTPGLKQNITSELDVTENSVTTDSFDLTFAIKDTSDQTFKASDWRYIVTYYTSVTSDDLPAGGTKYTNSVKVDGTLATGTATVPGRKYEKTGTLNNTNKTLDGVEHSAFTTLDWTVTIPGEKIDGLSSVTLTDSLGEAHQVCEAGDPTAGVAARLGVSVKVFDQIPSGGMTPTPSDLTGVTEAEVDGQEITLTVGPWSDGTFSRDYQYVISYTTCTTSGGIDAKGTEYTNEIFGSGIERSDRVTMNYNGSGTGTGVARGSVAVEKLVTGPGAAFVPDGTTFDVTVEEFAPGASEAAISYTLAVPVNGDPVQGLNQRGNGWTIKLSEPTFPTVPGVKFGAPQFAGGNHVVVSDGGTVATATITPATNIAVELTNTAELGQMAVTKLLEGPAAEQVDPDTEYSFTAAIDVSGLNGVPAQADRSFTLTADDTETLGNLPIGAVVTVTEVKPVDDDMFTWAEPVVSPTSVTITEDTVDTAAAVTVTNSVDRTVGTFSLSKYVVGAEAGNPAVPDEVTVTATWDEEGTPGEATLTLPTDGTTVSFGEDLLIGTVVTLAETPLADGSGIAWGAPVWSGTGVTIAEGTATVAIGRNADAHVALENHAATSTAGISVLKGIAGEAAGEVDPETEFLVTATWTDSEGTEQSRDLTINSVQPTTLGEDLPAGTVVTLTEGQRPGISTVVWDSITITGSGVEDNGDGSATVIVSDQQGDTTLITVTNEATWAPGTFALTKEVTGVLLGHPDVPDAVTVLATWIGADETERSKELIVPTDGTSVPFGEQLPHETEVTLTEAPLENSQSFTWDNPIWAGDNVTAESGSAVVTIGAATTAAVSLINNATVSLGSIELVKELIGTAEVPVTTVFPVTASWTDLMGNVQQQDVEVTVGTPTVIENLPLGVAIRLTENAADLPDNTRWDGVTWAAQSDNVTVEGEGAEAVVTVVGEVGSAASITLTNEIAELPDLDSTGDNKPTGDLASTGLDLGPWQLGGVIGVGMFLLMAGAVLLVVRRARRS